jgi:prevent-host-death family protein
MEQINLSEAKSHLGQYIHRVQKGESFIICERNQPAAVLIPIAKEPEKKGGVVLGIFEGLGHIPDDFNDPLPEMEESIDKPLFL